MVSRHLSNNCREIATCAITSNGDARGVSMQFSCVSGYPLSRGIAIFRCCREGMFGSKAVIHGDDKTFSQVCQAAAGGVMTVNVADSPTATMEKDQDWEWAAALRSVNPDGNLSSRTRNLTIFDIGDWFW